MTKKLTHIEKIRKEAAMLKMQVQNLLGWDDMQYATFQEAAGIAYLKLTLRDPSTGSGLAYLAYRLPEHKEYWSWWRMHWLDRDREFLEMSTMLFPHELEEYYRELNDPRSVPFRPHGAILEKTYMSMVHKLVKASTSSAQGATTEASIKTDKL